LWSDYNNRGLTKRQTEKGVEMKTEKIKRDAQNYTQEGTIAFRMRDNEKRAMFEYCRRNNMKVSNLMRSLVTNFMRDEGLL
jgi:hypothetical protein